MPLCKPQGQGVSMKYEWHIANCPHRVQMCSKHTAHTTNNGLVMMTWLAAVTPDCKKRWDPWQIIDIFSVCSDQCSGNAVRPSLGLRSFNQLLQTILSTNIFWSLSAKVGWPIYQLWMATQNVCKIGNQWHFWSQSSFTPLFGQFCFLLSQN